MAQKVRADWISFAGTATDKRDGTSERAALLQRTGGELQGCSAGTYVELRVEAC